MSEKQQIFLELFNRENIFSDKTFLINVLLEDYYNYDVSYPEFALKRKIDSIIHLVFIPHALTKQT